MRIFRNESEFLKVELLYAKWTIGLKLLSIVIDVICLAIFDGAKLNFNKFRYLLDKPLIQNDDVRIIFLKFLMNKNNCSIYNIEQVQCMLRTRLVKMGSD